MAKLDALKYWSCILVYSGKMTQHMNSTRKPDGGGYRWTYFHFYTTPSFERRPLSDFLFRMVISYVKSKSKMCAVWHLTECRTGNKAGNYTLTKCESPEAYRELYIEEYHGRQPYYDDHLAKCCIARAERNKH